MPSNRDLVEAQGFERRRLVTALVTGATDLSGAPRVARRVVGSVVLAVVLVAGVAIAGLLGGRDPQGWDEPGMLLSESGRRFLVLPGRGRPVLHPVDNALSARLILGADLRTTVVSDDLVDAQQRGRELGIVGAPQDVPSDLVQSGWTACSADGAGVTVDAVTRPTARAVAGGAAVVRTGATHHLLASAAPFPGATGGLHRYELPASVGLDALLVALDLPISADAPEVAETWLQLVPRGADIGFAGFGLEGYGTPAPGRGTGGLPADAQVGEVIEVGAEAWVLTAHGPARLDAFARVVYDHVDRPQPVSGPHVLEQVPRVPQATSPFAALRWPETVAAGPPPGRPCVVLQTAPGQTPVVALAADSSSRPEVATGVRRLVVEAGHGALVQVPDGPDPVLIDARGATHRLVGADTVDRLGLGDVEPALVPPGWLDLFTPGVDLSREAALCPAYDLRDQGCPPT